MADYEWKWRCETCDEEGTVMVASLAAQDAMDPATAAHALVSPRCLRRRWSVWRKPEKEER